MEQPIACSLDGNAARMQVDEWRALLASVVASVERTAPTNVTMRLNADPDAVASLIDLARREAACCRFFRFAVEVDAAGMAFTASVPPDATEMLDGFTELATK